MRTESCRSEQHEWFNITGIGNIHMNDRTIDYYDLHAEEFSAGTINADMSECRNRFLAYLLPGQLILDAGCGSGRDIIAFLKAGYLVEAFDASKELCRIASEKTGINVRQQRFEELEGQELYDGIWACASLLHVNRRDLPDVMKRLHKLLVTDGVLYASFKYGNGDRQQGDRFFCDFTEETITDLLTAAGFELCEVFITQDVREGRSGERWVNAIGRK